MSDADHSYWQRYGIALSVAAACAFIGQWGAGHGLPVLVALAAFGRLSDVASTVRILDAISSAEESAPGLAGKPRPWVLFALGVRQVVWIVLITFALGPFVPTLIGGALVAIAIASLAISVSNYSVAWVRFLYNPWSLQFAHPFDQLAPYRFRHQVEQASWHAFLWAQPVGAFMVFGLLVAEGWMAAPAYALLVLGAHGLYVLAKYLYFTAPARGIDRARQLEREALRCLPHTLADWPVDRRFAIASVGRMDSASLKTCLKRNRAARIILEETRGAGSLPIGLATRLNELAEADRAAAAAVFQLDQDPYARIEMYASGFFGYGFGSGTADLRSPLRRSWGAWRAMRQDCVGQALTAWEIARVRLLRAFEAAAREAWQDRDGGRRGGH